MTDRLATLEAFARVVETGSFTRAARALDVSRTTMSELIQQLEARVGVRLLNRTTRQVRVTPEGARYYERVVRLLADLDEADIDAANTASAPRGRLRVDLPGPIASLIVIPALPDFLARYPGIQLDLGVSDRFVDLIGDNVDCVLRGGVLADSALIARRLSDLPLGIYAAPTYLRQAGAPAHPRDLDDERHRMVGYRSPHSADLLPLVLKRAGETHRVTSRYEVVVDDGTACVAAGVAGLGVLCAPCYMAEPHVDRGELVPLLVDWRLDPMPLSIAWPQNRQVNARLRVFIDWMLERLPAAGDAPRPS